MRHTDNPLTFAFAKPEAKRVIYELEGRDELTPYNHVRKAIGTDQTTFKRLVDRLAQMHVVFLRSVEEATFEDRRIQMALELSPFGRELAGALHDLDAAVRKHEAAIGQETTHDLLVS